MNYQDVLQRYHYQDGAEIFERISAADKENYQENKDIINEIVLWKINRMPQITPQVIEEIYDLAAIKDPMEASENQATFSVIVKLLGAKGIRLPMASTILHFYHPALYPIIDQRAYRELYREEYPKYLIKKEALAQLYMQYVRDCYAFQQKNCPDILFEQIDKILYQLDKEKGNKVKY